MTLGLIAGALTVASTAAPPAQADYTPPPGIPATVTGDVLPTVQVNGVVWQQAVAGNTVYAVGNFTSARPAGAARGTNETPRANLLAYNLTTGALVTSFNHQLNGQGRSVVVSADGSRLYVGGDFTTVDGQPRGHVAAFDLPSGALNATFRPTVNGTVHALAATASTVYVGGSFTQASSTSRGNLVAYTAQGALTTWRPMADRPVRAVVLAPGGTRLVIGGHFKNVNGVGRLGLAAVDLAAGATITPWTTGTKLWAAGSGNWISSLSTDGTKIYGTGVQAGGGDSVGNFEGSFAVSPTNGDLILANDCHGDSYDNAVAGEVLYVASHSHDCRWMGGFPDYHPLGKWNRATAFTSAPRRVNTGPDNYGWNFNGQPASQLLHWFPDVPAGTFTGQNQGAWTIRAASGYVLVGGEFTSINGTPQQGLVRFASAAAAPKKLAPAQALMLAPTVAALPSGGARVTWTSTWDRDNVRLTHEVLRDGVVVHTVAADSVFWNRPTLTYTDPAPPGSHTYRIRTSDPSGNRVGGPGSAPVTTTAPNLARGAVATQASTTGPHDSP